MSEHIRLEVDDGIGILRIDRPAKKNAMTYAMLGAFLEQVAAIAEDDAIRVVIFTGVPGAFCAGTDLADLATIPGTERGVRGRADEEDRWWPLIKCGKPVIGAIDGPAVGMGAELSSQCDLRLATPRARFAWNFVHRGLVPDTGAGSWLLPRLIGPQQALKLLYTGDFLSAEQALEMGYVLELVEPERLLDRALELARRILSGSPFAQQRLKSLVYEGLQRDVPAHMTAHVEALSACFKSDDHREGVASFLERRPPKFTGT
ncbi:MAG: enoyl-CoA hydratase/isomerase family protein [Gammaproteobacteria bacterium]|nr:enoyl-CoA hydratase/isomerase family protein [Gammaproteobacteria bacterium]